MTLTPDERHAVAGELRWLARRHEQNAVMSPEWLRQRADWIEVSGERRAPARERESEPLARMEYADMHGNRVDPADRRRMAVAVARRADALDSVLRWGEPR